MLVLVSDVDSPVGHNVSRLLSLTTVGSRREAAPEEDAGGDDDGGDKLARTPSAPYRVVGTMLPPPGDEFDELRSVPAPVVETGDRQRDTLRRELHDKFAVRGARPSWVNTVVPRTDKDKLKDTILAADYIVYDLVQSLDEALWAVELLHEHAESFVDRPKTFIAISTVMTWARTKTDPDDPEAPLSEEDYRRRKAHPNFKNHLAAEKTIIKYGKKSSLKTYVVAPGLIYHPGDCIFHYMFKSAWHNEADVICYGDGANAVPTIHLDDLCNIIVDCVDAAPAAKYILAVDDSKTSLFDITKVISETLGTGKVAKTTKETALLNRALSQHEYDMLQVNLRLDSGAAKEMSFEWKCESGILENISAIVNEYKEARGLVPIRVIVHGAPSSGKTYFSKLIAAHYKIHYVELDQVMTEKIQKLEKSLTKPENAEATDEAVEVEDVEANREILEEISEYTKANNGKYPSDYIVKFLREKLLSMPCKNQGYILDGYPTVTEEALQLFKTPEEDDVPVDKGYPKPDPTLAPEFVLSFEASNDYIKERAMNLPESETSGTRNSEEALIKRLDDYRANNTEDKTILNYFDELEIHPLVVNVEGKSVDAILAETVEHVGKARNYGPTLEQLKEQRRLDLESKAKEIIAGEEERTRKEKEEEEKHSKLIKKWNARLDEVRKQEKDVLEAQSQPLRNYLMKFIMPTLAAGLVEVCKARPDDPVDYLADFLFKHATMQD